jgi:hypothetical protein
MRKTRLALLSSLAITAPVSSAWAQTPAPTTTATPAPPAATPPAATPAPAPAPAAAAAPPEAAPTPATPAPATDATMPAGEPVPSPAPEPAAEEESFPAAWFRIDSDLGGVQLWAGATHMLSDSVGIASDIYVLQTATQSLGEFDLGPSFIAGSFYITPMLGLQVDWSSRTLAALVPQLYVVGGPDPIYMELWLQNYAYTVFDKTNGGNSLYGRFFIDYKMGKYFGIGPEVEFTLALNDNSKADGESLTSLPIGLNIMLSNYGRNNVLYIFGGWETQDTPNDEHVAGRLTFVHNF